MCFLHVFFTHSQFVSMLLLPLGSALSVACIGYVFMSSIYVCVGASVRDVVSTISLVVCIALIDFHQTSLGCSSWDIDDLVSFWGQKVKGHQVVAY